MDNITPDNLITAQEAGQATLPVSGKVTGEFRPGDVATVSVNDKNFTAAVDAQGNFSVNVPMVDLLADPEVIAPGQGIDQLEHPHIDPFRRRVGQRALGHHLRFGPHEGGVDVQFSGAAR